MTTRKNFAITGVAGYIAPRHLRAIRDTGHRLVAALDPHDSVGILDRYFEDVAYFREFERFDRHLERLRHGAHADRVDFISICAPNFLHDSHIRLAFRLGADAVCEKPLVLNPWNVDALRELEQEHGRRVSTILQLRLHPALTALAERFRAERPAEPHDVRLTYITPRGPWYRYSWKGDAEKSGGLATNIGIHFFDLCLWLFGSVQACELHLQQPTRTAGYLELERARVRWFLSIAAADLPEEHRRRAGRAAYRSLLLDGQEVEFSEGFGDLHTRSYEEILAGRGFGLEVVRPSVALVHDLRHRPPQAPSGGRAHPFLTP